jgi:hypothetical protein
MKQVSILFLSLLCILVHSQEFIYIEGQVLDIKSRKALPYASVGIQNKHIGTITNQNGNFSLYIPDSLKEDTLRINFIGYEPYSAKLKTLANKRVTIKLKPAPTPIKAVTVRPLSAEEAIKQVIENFEKNYPQKPFIAEGYYLQEMIENGIYIDFIEAYVGIFNPPYGDTSECHSRMIQGRTKDDMGEIQFLSRFVEKKQAKQLRKAERKGNTIDSTGISGISVIFGGPKSIAEDDNIRMFKEGYSEKKYNKYQLEFKKNAFLEGRELYVIRARSKRAIDNQHIDARLYIDKETFALVKLKTTITLEVPTTIKPILRLYRIRINEIHIFQDIEYKLVNNVWYPYKTITYGTADILKKYSGKYKEHSIISLRKAFVATNILHQNVKPFAEEERLSDEPLDDQLGEYTPEFWHNRNKIEYEVKQ